MEAVGDRSAGGLETPSGSRRRGPCDAVSEPSPAGRIGVTDRVMAWHQPFHRRQPTVFDVPFGVRDGVPWYLV